MTDGVGWPSVDGFDATHRHADVFLGGIADHFCRIPNHASEPNLHRIQLRERPKEGLRACSLEIARIHSLASGQCFKTAGGRDDCAAHTRAVTHCGIGIVIAGGRIGASVRRIGCLTRCGPAHGKQHQSKGLCHWFGLIKSKIALLPTRHVLP